MCPVFFSSPSLSDWLSGEIAALIPSNYNLIICFNTWAAVIQKYNEYFFLRFNVYWQRRFNKLKDDALHQSQNFKNTLI